MNENLIKLNAIIEGINKLNDDSTLLDIVGAFKGLEYTASCLNYELLEKACIKIKEAN